MLVVAAFCLGAQAPAERLSSARRYIVANQYDSARAALRVAIDSASGASPAERAEGYVLLAIIEDHQGNLPAARAAIEQALRINPHLQVEGLDAVAPMVAPFLEQERCRIHGGGAVACNVSREMESDSGPRSPFEDCSSRCPEGVSKPRLRNLPDLGRHLPPSQMGPSGVRGQVTLEFIVGPEGFVDQGSARVTASTIRAFEDLLINRLTTARFDPALAPAGPVPARIRMRFDFRRVGLDRVSYSVRVL